MLIHSSHSSTRSWCGASDAALCGRVLLRITIGDDGKVCEATGTSDTKAMEGVATFRRRPLPLDRADVTYLRLEGGCAVVNAPISFVPTPDGGAP